MCGICYGNFVSPSVTLELTDCIETAKNTSWRNSDGVVLIRVVCRREVKVSGVGGYLEVWDNWEGLTKLEEHRQ